MNSTDGSESCPEWGLGDFGTCNVYVCGYRLADWVPTMRRAQPSGTDEVHVEGESHGHPYSLDSLLRTDESDRRLDWGAEGDDGYRGSLRITERWNATERTAAPSSSISTVTVSRSTCGRSEQASFDSACGSIGSTAPGT